MCKNIHAYIFMYTYTEQGAMAVYSREFEKITLEEVNQFHVCIFEKKERNDWTFEQIKVLISADNFGGFVEFMVLFTSAQLSWVSKYWFSSRN